MTTSFIIKITSKIITKEFYLNYKTDLELTIVYLIKINEQTIHLIDVKNTIITNKHNLILYILLNDIWIFNSIQNNRK